MTFFKKSFKLNLKQEFYLALIFVLVLVETDLLTKNWGDK